MPRKSDARDRFVRAAATLFRRRGYHGVGVADIIAFAEAPRGSFYHHFPGGKEELGVAAVGLAGRFVSRAVDSAFADATRYADGVAALAGQLAETFEQSNWTDGCPLSGIVADAGSESQMITAAVADAFDRWVERLAGHARRLNPSETAAEMLARRTLVALEGAWAVARATRSREPFDVAVGMLASSSRG